MPTDLDTDISPGLLEIFADLKLALGKIGSGVKAVADNYAEMQRRLTVEPAKMKVYGSPLWTEDLNPAVPASGPLLLLLGGPEIGQKWEIKTLAVCDGGNAQTTVTGKADFYIGQAVPPSGSLATWVPLPPTGWVWTFPNLPNLTTFSSKVRTVLPTDNLYCVVTGGTDEQSILAQAEIEIFEITPMLGIHEIT